MRRLLAVLAVLPFLALLAAAAPAQETAPQQDQVAAPEQAVSVEPTARDEAIQTRISRILDTTGWYSDQAVSVQEGVVFLDGVTGSEDHRTWARDLAARTEDVVAVVNRIGVEEQVSWDFGPALNETEALVRRFVVALPLIVLALLILPLAWWLSGLVAGLTRRLLAPRVDTPFLRDVIARAVAIPVFLVGLYLVLQVAGLTGLAVSLLGGAGVIGIVVGFAFRDIAENFLASLLLSIRRPFRPGDFIAVADHEGVVQTMNTRSTILLTIDGNHVQIPNATIFKSTIVSYTAAPARRVSADVGIGYDDSIADAQAVIASVLRGHEAVLDDPECMVLVDSLGASTVNLKAYFWIDGRTHSVDRVRSAVLRLMKRALVDNGISMPDEAREVIFPQGVPIVRQSAARSAPAPELAARSAKPEHAATAAEGGLGNETAEMTAEVADATIPEAASENLLKH